MMRSYGRRVGLSPSVTSAFVRGVWKRHTGRTTCNIGAEPGGMCLQVTSTEETVSLREGANLATTLGFYVWPPTNKQTINNKFLLF